MSKEDRQERRAARKQRREERGGLLGEIPPLDADDLEALDDLGEKLLEIRSRGWQQGDGYELVSLVLDLIEARSNSPK